MAKMSSTGQPPIGTTPSTQVPRYAGKATFARISDIHEVSDFEIAVPGVPFDGGDFWRVLPLTYQRPMVSGKAKLRHVENERYPQVYPTTHAAVLKAQQSA
jgi:hypothetical protein